MEEGKEKVQRLRRGRGRYLAGRGQTSIVSILDLLLPRQPRREWTWAMTMTRAKNSLEQPWLWEACDPQQIILHMRDRVRRDSSKMCRKGPIQVCPGVVGTVIIYTNISMLIKYVQVNTVECKLPIKNGHSQWII